MLPVRTPDINLTVFKYCKSWRVLHLLHQKRILCIIQDSDRCFEWVGVETSPKYMEIAQEIDKCAANQQPQVSRMKELLFHQ